jgi:hypothetical protein
MQVAMGRVGLGGSHCDAIRQNVTLSASALAVAMAVLAARAEALPLMTEGLVAAVRLGCAPFSSYGGRRGELRSRIRSALSPWLDCREQIDVIRDRLEEGGAVLPLSAST